MLNTSVIISSSIAMLLLACAKEDFKKSGESEKRKVVAGQDATSTTTNADEGVAVALATYEMTVKANTGLQLCKGQMKFIIGTGDLSPSGSVSCLIKGNIDLSTIFGAKSNVQIEKADLSQLKGHGMVFRKQNPVTLASGLQRFDPPRPFLLGPVVQNPNSFQNFVFREASRVNGVSKNGQPYQDTGEWYIETHEVGATFVPEGYTGDLQFNSVMKYEVKAVGFTNSPVAEFMGFESTTYWYNTKPFIAIPKIQIKTKLKHLDVGLGGSSDALGGITDVLFSGITIDLDLRDHQKLE